MKIIDNILERFKSLNNNKKFIYLFITLFFKTIINFFILFYVAKVVTVSDFGSFTLSFVIMTIGVLLIDYGYNLHSLVLNYENKEEISKNINSIISGKIFLVMVLTILFLPLFFNAPLSEDTKKAILILSIAAIPGSFGNFFFSLFKAKNKYQIETFGFLLQGLSLIILITINHYIGKTDIIIISYIIVITKCIYFFYSFLMLKRAFDITFKLSLKDAITSYKDSLSYGTHLIFGTLILYVETLLLPYFTNMETLGYYQSGLRIIMAASIFGAVITDGFVPEISQKQKDKKFITSRMVKLFHFLVVFYFLLLVTLGFYFNTVLEVLFSKDFKPVEEYTIYILLIILLRAIGIVPGIILTGLGLQKIRAKAVLYSLALSITFNLILIPYYGLEGAFISFMIANILLNGIYIFFAAKEINFIKNVKPSVVIVLVVYLILQYFLSSDNILYLLTSIVINLIALFLVQISMKKEYTHDIN